MTGYTRQSVPDIINGADITAPPLNAEFNQIAAAFDAVGGHAHDGSTGNGPRINLTTSVSGVLPTANGGTGGRYNMSATSNPTAMADSIIGYAPGSLWLNNTTGRLFICASAVSASAVWLEIVGVANGNTVTPTTNNVVDFGTSAVRYKNLYLSGFVDSQAVFTGAVTADSVSVATTSTFTGLLTANGGILNNGVFTNTGTFNMNGNVNIGDATGDTVTITARVASNLVPSADDTYDLGASTNEWRNLWLDGTANIDTLVADAVTVSGGSIDNTAIGATTASTIRGTVVTATTGFIGNLTGNVTGNTTGTHVGPVTGAVTGDVTGNITSSGTSTFNNVTINGTLDLNAGSVGTITGLSAPTNATDAATKAYVDGADALKVNKSGDTITGTITLSGGAKVTGLPTPTVNADAATKLYVDTAIANLINTAPGTLDTLNEIATALGNDPNFAATMTTELAKKLDKAGGTMTGAVDMGSNKITSLGAPTLAGDATTKTYVDAGDALKVSKSGDTMSGALTMGGNKVTGLGTPTLTGDAANKGYVDTADSLKVSKSGDTMSGVLDMGTNKVTNLAAPTVGSDATNKTYVDSILGSATSAATSAAAASSSATAAASSASAAATSASQAEAAYDNFDDRYLGPKASNPTADNDGNALLVGALYWNTVAGEMRVWSGSAWSAAYLPASGYVTKSGDTMTGALTVNSTITADGTVRSTTGGFMFPDGTTQTSAAVAGGISYTVKTSNYTAGDKEGILANTSGGAFTVTLPASPTAGVQVVIADAADTWGTNNLTIARNGSTIESVAEDLICDIPSASVHLIYNGTTWQVYTQVGAQGGTMLTPAAIGVTVQGYAADLQAIGALTGTAGFLQKTAANTWTLNTTNFAPLASPTFSGTVSDGLGKMRAIPRSGAAKTSAYTLTTSDVGTYINVGSGGSITIPNSTFSDGDAVSIYNDTGGAITINISTTTGYVAGTNTSRTSVSLATRGVATVLFTSGTNCVLSGNVS